MPTEARRAEASRFKVYFGDWRLWRGVRGGVPSAYISSGRFEYLGFRYARGLNEHRIRNYKDINDDTPISTVYL